MPMAKRARARAVSLRMDGGGGPPRARSSAQLQQGNFAPSSVTVSDLFAGALVPAFALVAMYILYLIGMAVFFPKTSPAIPPEVRRPVFEQQCTYVRREEEELRREPRDVF